MKKKILLLSDHPLSTSGVGTQARYLIKGLVATGKYSFVCFGGAIKHDNYNQVIVDDDFIIKPTDGFGDRNLVRLALAQEKPDALMLFTDPRFFIWVWEMEDEIHQVCPIVYNHLWDNPPAPEFNKVLYESTDLINCINYPTYEFCKDWFPDRTNFVPHAVPSDLFYPMKKDEIKKHRETLLQGRPADTFIALWVSRNARRKMPSDVIYSWKMFLDDMEKKHGHKKGLLVMHTDPQDQEGPNLIHVVNMLGMQNHVIFSKDRYEFNHMNALYNCADVTISRSSNEGFGLSMLESMMTATPIIALKTGGMTRQVVDHRDGSHNGIGLDPDVRSLVGSQLVPYIFEDFVSHETFAKALTEMYEYGPEKRAQLGMKALEYSREEFSMDRLIKSWDETLSKTFEKWESNRRQWSVTSL